VIPTTNERVDKVLTLARRRAASYADADNPVMASKTLLNGVVSAQRTNNSARVGSLLGGLWAMPVGKVSLISLTTVAIAARGRSGRSSSQASTPSPKELERPRSAVTETGRRKRRFRVSPRRRGGEVTVVDETRDPQGTV
jgi:hypothetical protein